MLYKFRKSEIQWSCSLCWIKSICVCFVSMKVHLVIRYVYAGLKWHEGELKMTENVHFRVNCTFKVRANASRINTGGKLGNKRLFSVLIIRDNRNVCHHQLTRSQNMNIITNKDRVPHLIRITTLQSSTFEKNSFQTEDFTTAITDSENAREPNRTLE